MAKELQNEVVFVQLTKRTIVDEVRTKTKYGSPEWKEEVKKQIGKAQVLDYAGIKFALSSNLGVFTIMVSEKDSKEATRLLENIK